MHRNKNLARELLEFLVTEDKGGSGLYLAEILEPLSSFYSHQGPGLEDAVIFHLHLLETAGFLKVTSSEHDKDSYAITWAGFDYLESPAE